MPENLSCLVNAFDESVDVRRIVVDVERSSRRSRNVEPAHQRLRAVMAGTNADTIAVENGREIVRMHIAHREAHDSAAFLRRRTIDLHSLDLRESLVGF